MASEAEAAAMRRAVELAARGRGRTNPNPVVGAVVLDPAGQPVGEGWHERAGGPHAEIVALDAAGERARGGTAVVTLEPCRHTGRTGPCTGALLAAGIARVVYAVADPSRAAGGGAAALTAAGVDVEGGLLAEQATAGNEAWLTAARLGRPYVTVKWAATLDGRTAAADGTSRWITGAEARADAHRLRAEADAVLVGVGTVLADDPELTVRALDWPRQPLRVVVDTRGRTPDGVRVLAGDGALVAVGPDAATRHPDVLRLPAGPGGVDLVALLDALYRRDVRSVLVEGGARLAGSFVQAGLVDRVVAYLAPSLLGAGAPVLAGAGAATITDQRLLHLDDVSRLGADVRLVARPRRDG